MTLADWLRVAEFAVVLLTSVVIIARWSKGVEAPPASPGGNGTFGVNATDIVRIKEQLAAIRESLDNARNEMSKLTGRMTVRDAEIRDQFKECIKRPECNARHHWEE